MLSKNDDLYDQNEEILRKVDVISNDRVISTGNPNDDWEEFGDYDIIYDYHALRIMKRSYEKSVLAHQIRHLNMEIILKISYSLNSSNLWTRVKKNWDVKK